MHVVIDKMCYKNMYITCSVSLSFTCVHPFTHAIHMFVTTGYYSVTIEQLCINIVVLVYSVLVLHKDWRIMIACDLKYCLVLLKNENKKVYMSVCDTFDIFQILCSFYRQGIFMKSNENSQV